MNEPTARVQVKVELWVTTSASWGGECTIAQAQSQGREAAIRLVSRLFEGKAIKGDLDSLSSLKLTADRVIIEDGT